MRRKTIFFINYTYRVKIKQPKNQKIKNHNHHYNSILNVRLNRSLSLTKNNVFLRSACCHNVFSLGQTDGHRYHDSPIPKTSSWMENCTKFGQLRLSKIIEIVASSCQILRLKCTKFDFSWGSAPDPAGGAQRSLKPPSWI